MNKILNWTFGACFRTLGRFLAIFIVFILLLFVGSKLDFDLPSWLSFKVSALEITQDVKLFGSKNFSYTNTDLQTRWIFQGKQFQSANDLIYYQWFINSDSYDYETYVDYIEIPLIIGQENISSTNEDNYLEYCIEWKKTSINGVEAYTCSNVSSTILDSLEYKPEVFLDNLNLSFYTHNIDGGYSMCTIKDNSILCPTRKMKIDFIGMFYSYKSNSTINYIPIYLGNVWQRYTITNFQEQINQNQQQTNDKLDDVNDSLQDTNQSIQDTNDNIMNSTGPDVSGMTDLAGYLPPGPLDSVLILPLSILNSLNSKLSSSCTPLTLTLPFVNLPLNIPCLSTIFSQIEGLNILWESLGVILGALIMYKYLVYLYNWVDDVTSLKHTHARLFGAKSDADNWGGVE